MFKVISTKIKSLPSVVKSAAIGTSLMGAAGSASADVGASITTAFTDAGTNVTAVAVGVIGLAAIVTGVSLIVAFLKK